MPNVTIYLDDETYYKFKQHDNEKVQLIKDKIVHMIKKEVSNNEIYN